jgi:hypothetical protein
MRSSKTQMVSLSALLYWPIGSTENRSLRHGRFSVSILEEGGRLGLKCLLLSYFRVGDNPSVTRETDTSRPQGFTCASVCNTVPYQHYSDELNVFQNLFQLGTVPLLAVDAADPIWH